MKHILTALLISATLIGCNSPKGQKHITAGFQTESFKNGQHVSGEGGARTYHYDQAKYNKSFDCDSFIITYHDPINMTFIFVKQTDSTWKLIQ